MKAAIERLNDRCENKLKSLVECRWVRSATKEDVKNVCGWVPYCEDQRLSINGGGELYKALYIPKDTPAISDEARADLLALFCSHHSMEECRPKNKGQMMDAWHWRIKAQASWNYSKTAPGKAGA